VINRIQIYKYLCSQAPLKRISVSEVGGTKQTMKKLELSESSQRPSSLELKQPISSTASSRNATPKTSTPRTPITPLLLSTPVYLNEIPEAPKNSVQLILTWNQIKPEDRYKYLSVSSPCQIWNFTHCLGLICSKFLDLVYHRCLEMPWRVASSARCCLLWSLPTERIRWQNICSASRTQKDSIPLLSSWPTKTSPVGYKNERLDLDS